MIGKKAIFADVSFFLLNSKKGEKLYLFWWFLICTVVFVVIVLTTVNFLAKPLDVREVQTKINYVNVYNCLVTQGYLNENVLESDFDLSTQCGLLNGKKLSDLKTLFSVSISDATSKNNLLDSPIVLGDPSIKADCELLKVGAGKYFSFCYERTSPVYYYENNTRKIAFLRILVATSYHGERLSPIQNISILNEEESS